MRSLRANGGNAGAIKAWDAFVRLFPPASPDVVQVNKWITEAQARVASDPDKHGNTEKKIISTTA